MASYKIMHLAHGKFGVEVTEGAVKPIVTGPYNTHSAACAYIEEHNRLAKPKIGGLAGWFE
jgi:hypothetical protein